MSALRSIRIIPSAGLDTARWDTCVWQDEQAKVYNYSNYLDAFAPEWQGLILGDYEACLPLPVYRRLNARWLQMPAFIQQFHLSVAEGPVSEAERLAITEAIRSRFKLIRYCCSENSLEINATRQRTNFVLPLHRSYEVLHEGFSKSGKKNIRKALEESLHIAEGIPIASVVALYQAAYGSLNRLHEKSYASFDRLMQQHSSHFRCRTFGVHNAAGDLVFAALLVQDRHALYYVLGAPTEEGRKVRATYFFINAIIEQHAGMPLKLDFEGSDLKNVADFYLSFGPQTEYYDLLQEQHYRFPVRNIISRLTGID